MKKSMFSLSLTLLIVGSSISAQAKHQTDSVWQPAKGVLCDRSMCVNGKEGVSFELTERYLGKKTVTKLRLYSEGSVDLTTFTFTNGISCDVKEQRCYVNRYYECDAVCNKCGEDCDLLACDKCVADASNFFSNECRKCDKCNVDCGLAACGADHCHHSAVSAKYTKLLFGIVVH